MLKKPQRQSGTKSTRWIHPVSFLLFLQYILFLFLCYVDTHVFSILCWPSVTLDKYECKFCHDGSCNYPQRFSWISLSPAFQWTRAIQFSPWFFLCLFQKEPPEITGADFHRPSVLHVTQHAVSKHGRQLEKLTSSRTSHILGLCWYTNWLLIETTLLRLSMFSCSLWHLVPGVQTLRLANPGCDWFSCIIIVRVWIAVDDKTKLLCDFKRHPVAVSLCFAHLRDLDKMLCIWCRKTSPGLQSLFDCFVIGWAILTDWTSKMHLQTPCYK